MKKMLPVALFFISLSGVAAEFTVTTSEMPRAISRPGVDAFSSHYLKALEFPRGVFPSARIKSISWSTASYPRSTGEKVKLCLGITLQEELCENITPNSQGPSNYFNGRLFQYAYGMKFRHSAEGGERFSRPSGRDSLTITFTY
jgi:hypothetical protein